MSVALKTDPRYLVSLISALTLRDMVAQYRDTAFGLVWAVLRPTLFMLVFSIVKGIAQLPSDGIAYPLFSFTGVSLWLFFVSILSGATPSITGNAGIIRKMPVPRIVFPLSGLLLAMIEYLLALIPLIGLFIFFRHTLSWEALYFFPIMMITGLLAFSIGLVIASFSVFKQDMLKTLPFILQSGLFLSPILYPLSSVPESYLHIYKWNPMVGPLEAIRSVLLHHQPPDWSLFVSTGVFIAFFFPVGLFVYQKLSKHFADAL